MTRPRTSVVIPTKDRPRLLRRCLDAVLAQETDEPFEVVVVNDQGCSVEDVVERYGRVRLVEGPGRGPAAARNAGIGVAAGEIVLFTDDDAVPQPGWIQAAVRTLAGRPDATGVTGRVESPEFDPLHEHSVRSEGGVGNFLTCNIAYRRSVLEKLGGFDEGFRHAHEDRDLGLRALRLGAVIFAPDMLVVHPPRSVTAREVVRRGRFIRDDPILHAKHPQTRPPRWSTRWGPLVRLVRHWQRLAADGLIARSPRRAARFAILAGGQIALAAWVTIRGGTETAGDVASQPARGPALRIAWIGPTPVRGGGVAGVGWHLVHGLAERGCEVDCFLTGDHDQIPRELWELPGVRVINVDTGWRFDRWYSNHALTKVLTGLAATAWGRRRLASLLLDQHRGRRYDVVYQFSTIEIFGLRRHLDELPPLMVHPETHAAGELRGMRAERHLSARCEPWWRRAAVEALQRRRARRQRRDIQAAAQVVAISRCFGQHLVEDYGVPPSRLVAVPNPIDLEELQAPSRPSQDPIVRRILFVGRISVRKGVDAIVELSHRLGDLEGQVVLEIVGAETLWSDYRPLLGDLNPAIGRYRSHLSRVELIDLLGSTDLLVQPATFEPFGLTVGEALACGVPVVATEEVGAAEDVDESCCIVVPAGDVDALEKGVREMLDRVGGPAGEAIRARARSEAERLFHPDRIGTVAYDALAAAARQAERPA